MNHHHSSALSQPTPPRSFHAKVQGSFTLHLNPEKITDWKKNFEFRCRNRFGESLFRFRSRFPEEGPDAVLGATLVWWGKWNRTEVSFGSREVVRAFHMWRRVTIVTMKFPRTKKVDLDFSRNPGDDRRPRRRKDVHDVATSRFKGRRTVCVEPRVASPAFGCFRPPIVRRRGSVLLESDRGGGMRGG